MSIKNLVSDFKQMNHRFEDSDEKGTFVSSCRKDEAAGAKPITILPRLPDAVSRHFLLSFLPLECDNERGNLIGTGVLANLSQTSKYFYHMVDAARGSVLTAILEDGCVAKTSRLFGSDETIRNSGRKSYGAVARKNGHSVIFNKERINAILHCAQVEGENQSLYKYGINKYPYDSPRLIIKKCQISSQKLFSYAGRTGDLQALTKLIGKSAYPSLVTYESGDIKTGFLRACEQGVLSSVQFLDSYFDKQDRYLGLEKAISKGHFDIFKYFLSRIEDPAFLAKALKYAAKEKQPQMVREILQRKEMKSPGFYFAGSKYSGAYIANNQIYGSESTFFLALIKAVFDGSSEVVKEFLNSGLVHNSSRQSAYILAKRLNNSVLAEAILETLSNRSAIRSTLIEGYMLGRRRGDEAMAQIFQERFEKSFGPNSIANTLSILEQIEAPVDELGGFQIGSMTPDEIERLRERGVMPRPRVPEAPPPPIAEAPVPILRELELRLEEFSSNHENIAVSILTVILFSPTIAGLVAENVFEVPSGLMLGAAISFVAALLSFVVIDNRDSIRNQFQNWTLRGAFTSIRSNVDEVIQSSRRAIRDFTPVVQTAGLAARDILGHLPFEKIAVAVMIVAAATLFYRIIW